MASISFLSSPNKIAKTIYTQLIRKEYSHVKIALFKCITRFQGISIDTLHLRTLNLNNKNPANSKSGGF